MAFPVVHKLIPVQLPDIIRQKSLGFPDLQERTSSSPDSPGNNKEHKERNPLNPVLGLNIVP